MMMPPSLHGTAQPLPAAAADLAKALADEGADPLAPLALLERGTR
jgi:hypothetical protein